MTANTGTVTLTCASVNGGVAVNLNASTVNYAWKNNIKADPIASSYDITDVEHRGWENPNIVVRGTIDTANTTNHVTHALLQSFSKVKDQALTLNVVYGETGSEITLADSDGDASGIKVLVDTFTLDIDVTSAINAHVISYTIAFIEDKD